MKKSLLTIGIVLLGLFLMAQEKSMEMADKAYVNRDYLSAIKYYNKALRKTDDFNAQQHIAGQIAQSYFAMNNYAAASKWFEDALGDRLDDVPTGICYARALAADLKYAEAHDVLTKLVRHKPGDIELKTRLAALDLIMHADKSDSLGLVMPVNDLNSLYSDYGIAYWNEVLVFSSTRQLNGSSRIDGRTGQGFSDLFYADPGTLSDQWQSPQLMSGVINSPNNDGTFVYDAANHRGYWTSCTSKPDKCLLYQADYNPISRKWTGAARVSFMNEDFNYGHPYISAEGNTLYFTSNMPGGYGKNDLWKITRKPAGQWGIPVNLGNTVNTAANEVFPYLLGDSLLFFASDRITSMGGLDLFFSVKEQLNFAPPINLGYPINSAADDFSLITDSDAEGGFFCSNRNPESSDDIYRFKGFPIKIRIYGSVVHELDKKPIAGAKIFFINDKNQPDSVMTNSLGAYQFQADAFNEYRLTASFATFFTEKKVVNTHDRSLFSTANPAIQVDFMLSKTAYPCAISGDISERESNQLIKGVKVEISNKAGFSGYTWSDANGHYHFGGLKPQTIYTVRTSLAGYFSESRDCVLPKVDHEQVFNKNNGYDMDFQLLKIQTRSEVVINNIYFDYNKATLREVSRIELNKLASMLRETPGVSIQINAHTDSRGRDDYNMELSAERATSVVNYLVDQGISRNRLIAKGWGEKQLLIKNAKTEDEHQANRRTTFNVIHQDDAPDVDGNKETLLPEEEMENGLEYRVQLLTSGITIDINTEFAVVLANIQPIRIFVNQEGTTYKYEAGNRSTLKEINGVKKKLREWGYRDCFVVCYYQGQRIALDLAQKKEKEVRK